MREERILERIMEASLAAQRFGQEIWLWHISMVSDEHPNGTTGVDYQHLRFIRSEAEFHSVVSLAFALADWYPGILRKWPKADGESNAVTTVVAPGATQFTRMVGEFATQLTHL